MGTTPQAPCTQICMRKPPSPSSSGVPENAHSGSTGRASRAAMVMARRRPIRSDSAPKTTPPRIAPRFMTMTRLLAMASLNLCCALRKVG